MKLTTLLVITLSTFVAGCDGTGLEGGVDATADAGGVDGGTCAPIAVASVTGCVNTMPIPLNLLSQPVDFAKLVVFVDGVAQPRDRWGESGQGHTVTFTGSTCNGGSNTDQHLIGACVAE